MTSRRKNALIVSSSTIDIFYQIHTFYKNRYQIYIFYENRYQIYIFYENKYQIYIFYENLVHIFVKSADLHSWQQPYKCFHLRYHKTVASSLYYLMVESPNIKFLTLLLIKT